MASRQDIETLEGRVYEAKRTLSELKKTPQAVGGDSWVIYRHDIRPGWDFEVHGISDPTYVKKYKFTYQVPQPERGFMEVFYDDYVFDIPSQDMSVNVAPDGEDPYSFWLLINHSTFNSNVTGVKIRFLIFSTQRGNLVYEEEPL